MKKTYQKVLKFIEENPLETRAYAGFCQLLSKHDKVLTYDERYFFEKELPVRTYCGESTTKSVYSFPRWDWKSRIDWIKEQIAKEDEILLGIYKRVLALITRPDFIPDEWVGFCHLFAYFDRVLSHSEVRLFKEQLPEATFPGKYGCNVYSFPRSDWDSRKKWLEDQIQEIEPKKEGLDIISKASDLPHEDRIRYLTLAGERIAAEIKKLKNDK